MPGNKVSVYQGKFSEVFPKVMVPVFAQDEVTKTDAENWSQMWVDLDRAYYLPTEGATLEDYLKPLLTWDPKLQSAEDMSYIQGEIDGKLWTLSTQTDINFSVAHSGKNVDNADEIMLQSFSFVYLDDTKTLCGVTVAYLKSNPEVFCASIVRNCRAPANEREVFYMVSESIATQKERVAHPVAGQPIELAPASQQFRNFLRSRELSANMHDLFSGRAVNKEAHARFDHTKDSFSGEIKPQNFATKIAESLPESPLLSNPSSRKEYTTAAKQRAEVIGNRPLRIRGSHSEVVHYLGIDSKRDEPLNLARDIERLPFAQTEACRATDFLSRIEGWAENSSVDEGLYYSQGDLDASNFANFLKNWQINNVAQDELKQPSTLSFAYVDDKGKSCGVMVARIPGTPHWMAAITRDTMAKPEDREVEVLCSPAIAGSLRPSGRVKTEFTRDTHSAQHDFMTKLDSASIRRVLEDHQVFTETGEPSAHLGDLQEEPIEPTEGETAEVTAQRQSLYQSFKKAAPNYQTRIQEVPQLVAQSVSSGDRSTEESSLAEQSRPSDEESLAERIGKLAFKSPPRAATAGSSGFRLKVQSDDGVLQTPVLEPTETQVVKPSAIATSAPKPAPSFFERNKFSLPLTIAAGVGAVALFALAGVFTAGIVPTILGVCGIVAGGICLAGAVKVIINEKEEKARLQEADRGQQGSVAMMLEEMGSRLRGNDTGAGAAPKPVKGILRKGDSPQKSTKRVQFDLPKEDTGAGVGLTDSDDDSLTDSTGSRLGMNG